MAIDFPASPSLNQTYSYDGKTWIWNGSGWAAYGTIISATAPVVYSSGAFSLSGTTAQFNTALTDGDFATLAGSEVLTGKTISGANNTLSNIGNSSLTNSAITVNGTAISLGSSGTITAANPNALTIGTGLSGTSYSGSSAVTIAIDSTVATLTGTQVFTNKSLSDSTTYIVDNADNTKRLQFDITGTTGITGIFQTAFTTAKTVVFQDVAGTVYVSGGTDVSLADGGTGASLTASNGGIVYSTGSAMAILTGTATAGQILRSGASGAPSWSTATYPSTTTANQILYSSAANTISGITTANNQVLVTNASGVPAFSGTLPSGVTASSLTSFGTSPTLTTPTIDIINSASATGTSASLFNNNTTGTISIAPATTTGTINIGGPTAAGTAGTVNILTGTTTSGTKAINIGTNGSTGSTTTIIIGTTTGTTPTVTLRGTVGFGSGGIAGTAGTWHQTATAPTGTTQLNYEGYLYATKVYNAVFNDYAEYFEKADKSLTPGDLISINRNGSGYVKSCCEFDPMVVGVYSDDYAQCIGGKGDGHDDENFISVGMAGRVRVKVIGEVNPGDLLVASSIPGVAMAGKKEGCVIGKALVSHTGDTIDRIQALILNA